MAENNDKQYYGKLPLIGENLFLSAKVGFLKFVDLLTMANIDEDQLKGSDEKVKANVETYNRSKEQAKQDVKDAMKERDSFYIANDKDLGLMDKIAGGLVESISNPFELSAQVGIGTATGGASIPLQLGAQASFDVAQATYETQRYEDRTPTPKEIATTIGMSLAPDLLFMGAGNYIRKAKSTIANSTVAGDININVRNEINSFDSILKDDMSKPQQMYTDYGVGDSSVYLTGKKTPMEATKLELFEKMDKLAADNPDYKYVVEQWGTKLNSDQFKLMQDEIINGGANTILSRSVNTGKFLTSEFSKVVDNDLIQMDIFNHKKTDIQNIKNINKKLNPVIDNLIEGTIPTVEDYLKRWEIKADKIDKLSDFSKTIAGQDNTPTINYSQIDTALNSIDAKFSTQRLYVQNEYIQKLGMTPKEFLNEVGGDGKDITSQWLKNEFNSSQSGYDFLISAYKDSVMLDELKIGASLTDMAEFESFHRSYGRSFDIDQNVVYDDVLLDTLFSAKNKPNDLNLLKEAMYSNPDEYVTFIVNAKENVANIKGVGSEFKKEFINSEYDKLITGLDVSSGPKLWKKEIAKKISERRRKLAEESIKINQSINKQAMLGDFDKYYETKISKENVKDVKLSEEGLKNFEAEIMPLYNNGTLATPENGDYERHFAELISDLKKTRSSAKWTGEYKAIGELRPYFGKDKMVEFFEMGEGKYLKSNAELVRDIFDRQTSDIARFIEFGSTSPFVLKNRVNFELKKVASEKIGKELSDAQKVAYQTIIYRTNNMIINTQTGATRLIPTAGEEALSTARGIIRRGMLSGTGIAELGVQNYAIASMRAQKYGGAKVYINTPLYQAKRMVKGATSDLPNAKYNIAQLRKDTDLSYVNRTSLTDKFDNFAFSIQDYSAKQMSRYGEAHATSILHNLPNDFNSLENELKDLLKKQGVDENNFTQFKKLTKEHIDNNGLTVNMQLLSESAETGNEMAYNLLNSYYQLSDDIGNPMSKSKMRSKVVGEIEQWYSMFKGFSRNLNSDTIGRVLNYTNADGLSKSRLNFSQYKADLGYGGIAKETALFATGLTSMAIGGYAYTQSKELLQSDRSMDQKLAVMQIKSNEILDAIKDNQKDMIPLMVQYSSINPLEMIEATNIPKSLWQSASKIYGNFTDEEKKAYGGTNIKEGTTLLVNEMLKYTASRVGVNVAKSIQKTATDDDVSTLEKVYGLTPEQQLEYESIVRGMNYEEFKIGIMEDRTKIKSEIDMLEGSTETYNKIDKQERDLFEQSLVDNNIKESDADNYRTEYAVISKASKDIEDTMEAVKTSMNIDMRPTKEVLETKPVEPTNDFEALPKKKRNYFFYIMAYKGIDNPTEEDYTLYTDKFKTATGDDFTKALNDVYGINRNELVKTFKSDEVRRSALKIYK